MPSPVSWPQRGEWRRAIAISSILIVSAMMQGICDVLATSGVGERGIVWMWAVDAGIALVGIGALARGVDSMDRRRLGMALLTLFAASYLFVWNRTLHSDSPTFWWGMLGVVDTLQSNLVVLLAWALARDLFDESQAIRLFGLLGGLAYVGTLAGTGLAGFVAKRTLWGLAATDTLLPLCATLAVLTALVVAWLVPPDHLTRPAESDGERSLPLLLESGDPVFWRDAIAQWRAWRPGKQVPLAASLRKLTETLHSLLDSQTLHYRGKQPTLRWLSALQVGNAASWTMMSLAVLFALRSVGSDNADLQQAYSHVRIVGPLAHAMMQAALSGWLLRRLGYGRLFLLTPLVLLLNLALLGIAPSLTTAWAASLLIQFAFGAEGAAAHALLVRTPAHMRGRVGTFVMGTLPQIGYIVGCALLFAARWFADALGWAEGNAMRFTIAVGVLAALANVSGGNRLRRAFAEAPDVV